jgi:hypothetical protein
MIIKIIDGSIPRKRRLLNDELTKKVSLSSLTVIHIENNLTNYFLFVLTNQKNKLSSEPEQSPIDTSESRSYDASGTDSEDAGRTSSSKVF